MSDDTQLIFALGYYAVMFVLFVILKRYTPKKINLIYGYRTPRSMKNQDTWTLANAYSYNLLLHLTLWGMIIPVSCYFIYPEENLFISIVGHSLLLFVVVFFTERKLWLHFDSDGNPKKIS